MIWEGPHGSGAVAVGREQPRPDVLVERPAVLVLPSSLLEFRSHDRVQNMADAHFTQDRTELHEVVEIFAHHEAEPSGMVHT